MVYVLQSEINTLIDENEGSDKLWDFVFKNTKDLGEKRVSAYKISGRLDKDKLIIVRPADEYGNPEEKFEVTILNILTISPYQEPEMYILS